MKTLFDISADRAASKAAVLSALAQVRADRDAPINVVTVVDRIIATRDADAITREVNRAVTSETARALVSALSAARR